MVRSAKFVRWQCRAWLRRAGALARAAGTKVLVAWPPVLPTAWQHPPDQGEDLLRVALEALNIARDNKALVVVRAGAIIDINKRGLDLCGFLRDDLLGKNVMSALFAGPAQPRPAAACWRTLLKSRSGASIA